MIVRRAVTILALAAGPWLHAGSAPAAPDDGGLPADRLQAGPLTGSADAVTPLQCAGFYAGSRAFARIYPFYADLVADDPTLTLHFALAATAAGATRAQIARQTQDTLVMLELAVFDGDRLNRRVLDRLHASCDALAESMKPSKGH